MTSKLMIQGMACCRRGDLNSLRFLLSLEPELMIETDYDGQTLLHVASDAGTELLVDFLLSMGANVHARTVDGSTPLCSASAGGWPAVISKLVSNGAQVNPLCQLISPLHEAAALGRSDCCQLLIELGANMEKSDCWLGTPLHVAIHEGHLFTAKVLLDAGAKVNAKNIHATPLHYACRRGNTAAVLLLLMYGANVYDSDNHNQRPSALLSDDHPAKEILIHYEANPKSLMSWCRKSIRDCLPEKSRNDKKKLAVDLANACCPSTLVQFLLHNDTERMLTDMMNSA